MAKAPACFSINQEKQKSETTNTLKKPQKQEPLLAAYNLVRVTSIVQMLSRLKRFNYLQLISTKRRNLMEQSHRASLFVVYLRAKQIARISYVFSRERRLYELTTYRRFFQDPRRRRTNPSFSASGYRCCRFRFASQSPPRFAATKHVIRCERAAKRKLRLRNSPNRI